MENEAIKALIEEAHSQGGKKLETNSKRSKEDLQS